MMNVRTEGLLWISIQNKKMTFIFVHGFQGWGSYDKRYKKMPYWGMRGGRRKDCAIARPAKTWYNQDDHSKFVVMNISTAKEHSYDFIKRARI